MSWLSKACKKLKKLKIKDCLPVLAAVTALIPGVGIVVAGGLTAAAKAIGKVGAAVGKGATQAIGTALGAIQGVSGLGSATEKQVAEAGGPIVAGMMPKKIKTWMIVVFAGLLAYVLFWKKGGAFGHRRKAHHSSPHHSSPHHSSPHHSSPHHSSAHHTKKGGFGNMTHAERLKNLAKARRVLAQRRAAGTVKHHKHRKSR